MRCPRCGHVWEQLSERERQILPLIVQGMTNAEIALHFGTAQKTVAQQISTMLAKLGMRSRTQLAVWAIRQGLVDEGKTW